MIFLSAVLTVGEEDHAGKCVSNDTFINSTQDLNHTSEEYVDRPVQEKLMVSIFPESKNH